MMFISSVVIAIIILLIGLFVIARDSKKTENRLFFAVTLISAVWALNYYLIDKYSSLSLVSATNAISYILGLLLLCTVMSFTYFFPKKKAKKGLKRFSIPLIIMAILSPTPLVNGSVTGVAGNYEFTEGPLSIAYVLVLLLGSVFIFFNLLRGRKGYTQLEKAQSNTLAQGFVLSFITGIFLSTLLPIISPSTVFVDLAPFSVVFLILFSLLAITRHKLFDFRTVLLRAVSYLSVTAILAVIYVSFLFLARKIIFPGSTLSFGELGANVSIGLILVVTYPYVKKYFDKISNSLFFRDNYDPQTLLDRLNQTLVANIDLQVLLSKSSDILAENLKSSTASFYIRETAYFGNRTIGKTIKDIPKSDMDRIQVLTAKLHKKVHSTQQETTDANEKELNKLLQENNIELLGRLVSTLDYEINGIGYILLGPKRSGGLYTSQDLKIIEIIANELVIATENALRLEEIEQFNVTLQKKIDSATKELKQTNEKLLALDEAKDEFVSMASHQLRTPLTSIKGYISMVLEGDAGKINDSQKQMLSQAMFSSQRMVYLISDLLNVSRLKTGKFVIEAKPVYLPDLVESELAQLYDGANAKNIRLSFAKPKSFPTLNLDDMKIRQVVMNFTDNSIYYTPSGGKIVVELKEKKDSVEFRVKDSGIGVPKSEQHKLFAKFYRADNARKARPDGTGLGLFMAKKVIVAQGGSLIFESKEGKGSTFGFLFPKAKLEITTTSVEKS
jgi:signal transduction histidine kinase